MPAAPEKMWPVLCGTDSAVDRLPSVIFVGPAPVRPSALRSTGSPNINPSFCSLAAHLLQQFVDERASEHVEKTGSNPSMDA